ncbi:MAG: hypothetical protein LBR31_02910 [Desulfovibrio sp.]|nr:hypothetical protein [Desulfovibrio sp.]
MFIPTLSRPTLARSGCVAADHGGRPKRLEGLPADVTLTGLASSDPHVKSVSPEQDSGAWRVTTDYGLLRIGSDGIYAFTPNRDFDRLNVAAEIGLEYTLLDKTGAESFNIAAVNISVRPAARPDIPADGIDLDSYCRAETEFLNSLLFKTENIGAEALVDGLPRELDVSDLADMGRYTSHAGLHLNRNSGWTAYADADVPGIAAIVDNTNAVEQTAADILIVGHA